ncbi:SOS response-associated peptidase [Bifidobacterium callimiconis]|uniref:Abasic site processing protein n=1 Tax=Bifidobacterium callimiconis TaxID=2306973 RepID=A0A430FI42_9BIFI|nr:SOS response-associated peptidase [Bifidobacterium callimiconis]MBT1176489.1 SOS response-associated peptidase [Bifidobacterium callimiconis]RSX52378.1 SOS response associated peptidase (SRAP) [Bifidobacterium callimiconis]
MCRRFAIDLDWNAVAEGFSVDGDDVDGPELPEPSYDVAPGQTIAVVAQGKDGRRHLTGARWSLVPRWSTTDGLPYPTYNARVESAASKPTFAESTRSMRCVIPASGYYEWRGVRPFYFHAVDDAPLFMAGLYSWWRASGSMPWLLTATIITCGAVDGPASVHDRMPMLVSPVMRDAWLDPTVDGSTLLEPVHEHGLALSRALAFHEVAPLDEAERAGVHDRRLIRSVVREEPLRLF